MIVNGVVIINVLSIRQMTISCYKLTIMKIKLILMVLVMHVFIYKHLINQDIYYSIYHSHVTSQWHVVLESHYKYFFICGKKTFAVPRLYLHSQKNVHGYRLLQVFTVFTCKILPKSFQVCEIIHEKM